MRSKPIIAASWPIWALALSGCAHSYEPEPSLPVRPQVSEAPRFATPPAELMRRPEIVDFLPTEESLRRPAPSDARPKNSSGETSSQPSKRFSSTP